jgi:hypothetical protein
MFPRNLTKHQRDVLPEFLLLLVKEAVPIKNKTKFSAAVNILGLCSENRLSFEAGAAQLKALINTSVPIAKLIDWLENTPGPDAIKPATRQPTKRWTPEEDQRLIDAVAQSGTRNWGFISSLVGNRSKSQCSQRWARCLNPRISKDNWSAEEEQQLLDLVAKHGVRAWTKIGQILGDRTDVQCRFRYGFLKKKAAESHGEVRPVAERAEIVRPGTNWIDDQGDLAFSLDGGTDSE